MSHDVSMTHFALYMIVFQRIRHLPFVINERALRPQDTQSILRKLSTLHQTDPFSFVNDPARSASH